MPFPPRARSRISAGLSAIRWQAAPDSVRARHCPRIRRLRIVQSLGSAKSPAHLPSANRCRSAIALILETGPLGTGAALAMALEIDVGTAEASAAGLAGASALAYGLAGDLDILGSDSATGIQF